MPPSGIHILLRSLGPAIGYKKGTVVEMSFPAMDFIAPRKYMSKVLNAEVEE